MREATAFLTGGFEADEVSDLLARDVIVVLAKDRHSLERWLGNGGWTSTPQPPAPPLQAASRRIETGGLVIDLVARRVSVGACVLPITQQEVWMLALLASEPGTAFSFHELRCSANGEGPDLGNDVFPVQSAVQRLRRKLVGKGSGIAIEPVRGFGYRLVETAPHRLVEVGEAEAADAGDVKAAG